MEKLSLICSDGTSGGYLMVTQDKNIWNERLIEIIVADVIFVTGYSSSNKSYCIRQNIESQLIYGKFNCYIVILRQAVSFKFGR